jgi:hypothetical protein
LDDAFEGMMSLLNPGSYGVAENDPKAVLIRDLGRIASELGIRPVIIGGIAVVVNGLKRQTVDVDLLVARADALKLVRKLEATLGFSRVRIDRFTHGPTGCGVDLCVEGELTSPHHKDRFPAPADVEQLPRDPLPVVGLIDLLALKAKSARVQDEGDFVRLFKDLGLTAKDVEAVRGRIQDEALRANLDRWHARALEEIERDKLMRPPQLE